MSFKFYADEVAFREQTDRQARMAGVTGPSFRCVACKRVATTPQLSGAMRPLERTVRALVPKRDHVCVLQNSC